MASSWHLSPPAAVLLEVVGGIVALACGAALAMRLVDGTEPARLAEASLPGWQRFRTRIRMVTAW
jgi:hypothetical protein